MGEATSNAGPARLNLVLSIDDFLKEVRSMRAALERQVGRLERMEKELTIVLAWMLGPAPPPGLRRVGTAYGQTAYSLSARRLPDDSGEFQIDGGGVFHLAPRLADVLLFLARSSGPSEDELVPWKARSEVLESLEGKAKKRLRRQYVNNLINLLKLALAEAGQDPRLIQTHRRKGVRFALKRQEAHVIGGDWS